MRLLHARGRTVEALRLYERLRARLQDEFGVPPEQPTAQLYKSIRKQRAGQTSRTSPMATEHRAVDPEFLDEQARGRGPAVQQPQRRSRSAIFQRRHHRRHHHRAVALPCAAGDGQAILLRLSRHADDRAADRGQAGTSPTSSKAASAGAATGSGSTRNSSMPASGNQLWAERYDRALIDIFAVQDEVARSVAAAVSGRVGVVDRERVVRLSPTELHAYDLVLRARAYTLRIHPRRQCQGSGLRRAGRRTRSLQRPGRGACGLVPFLRLHGLLAGQPAHVPGSRLRAGPPRRGARRDRLLPTHRPGDREDLPARVRRGALGHAGRPRPQPQRFPGPTLLRHLPRHCRAGRGGHRAGRAGAPAEPVRHALGALEHGHRLLLGTPLRGSRRRADAGAQADQRGAAAGWPRATPMPGASPRPVRPSTSSCTSPGPTWPSFPARGSAIGRPTGTAPWNTATRRTSTTCSTHCARRASKTGSILAQTTK